MTDFALFAIKNHKMISVSSFALFVMDMNMIDDIKFFKNCKIATRIWEILFYTFLLHFVECNSIAD